MTKKRRNILLVVLGVAAGVALLLTVGVFGIYRRVPTDEEKALVLTVKDLAPYGIAASDSTACESWLATRNIDFSLEVEYEYDAEADPEFDGDVNWFLSQAEINTSPRDARDSFAVSVGIYKRGFPLASGGTLACEERPGLFTLGDQNYAARLMSGGLPVGTIVITRKGRTLFTLVITGAYVDDPDILRELLEPRLARAAAK